MPTPIPFAMSGPGLLYKGVSASISIVPSDFTIDTVTFSDNSGGTFSPTSLTWENSNVSKSVQYTSSVVGNVTIAATSQKTASISGSPLTIASYGVAIDAYISKSGKLGVIGSNSSYLIENGNYVPAYVKSINSSPYFYVNGRQVQIGPPTWGDQSLDFPFVSYLMQCGGVESLAMINAGTTSYTAPTITWNGDGGGTGLIPGTPVLASGIIAYQITNAGSGFTSSFYTLISGGTYSQQATAWVNVVNSIVTSVVPVTGSCLAYGQGYTGGNFSSTISGSGGSGLVVTCVISNYIQNVPIVNPGINFTGPPTFTITDSTGAGAIVAPVMSGLTPNDVVTYSVPTGMLTTSVEAINGLLTPPMTGASVINWTGQLEGPTGRMIGFTGKPTMGFGGNVGYNPSYYSYNVYFTAKNKLKASQPWNPNLDYQFGPTYLSLDSYYFPQYWDANTWVSAIFYSSVSSGPPLTNAQYEGTWTYQYDDDYYNGVGANPHYTALTSSSSTHVVESVIPGNYTVLPTAGSVTRNGNGGITAISIANHGSGLTGILVRISDTTGQFAAAVATINNGSVSSIVITCIGQTYSANPTISLVPIDVSGTSVTIKYNFSFSQENIGGNMCLSIQMVSGSDGENHIHNPWVFAPGNTIDRSKPFATDDNVIRSLSGNGKKGPSVLRFMDALGGPTAPNMIDPSDIPDPNLFSWAIYYNFNSNTPLGNPNSPSFQGTLTKGSSVITGIADTSSLSVNNPIVGIGIPGIVFSNGSNNQSIITQINDSHSITISNSALTSGVQSLSVNPTPSGRVTFNKARFYNTNPSSGTYSWSSPRIYSSESWAISGQDSFGTYLDITNGPDGLDDNGHFVADPIVRMSGQPAANIGIIELVSNSPHGIKTGFYTAAGSVFSSVYPFLNGTTTNGSAQITGITGISGLTADFSLEPGQVIQGTGIPSGASIISVDSPNSITLSVNATASGTVSLTAISYISWNLSGSLPFDAISTYLFGVIFVTGPNTIVLVSVLNSGLSGSNFQTVNSTTEIPVWFRFSQSSPNLSLPFEYAAAMVSEFPGCILHLNLPFVHSDALIRNIVPRIINNIGPTNQIAIEMGNEHWGAGAAGTELPWEYQMANMPIYLPVGTNLYPHFDKNGNLNFYTTNGSIIPTNDQCYAIRSSNTGYVFINECQSLGFDTSRIKVIYGSQWNATGSYFDIVTAVKNYHLSEDYLAVAPYSGIPAEFTAYTARQPAGYAGSNNNGNWPVDAICDLARTYQLYNQSPRTTWRLLANAIQGTNIKAICYECAMQDFVWDVPFSNQVQQDLFYKESFYDVIWGYALGMQIGDPNTLNSGSIFSSYYSLYADSSSGSMWKLADSVAQSIGKGSSNQFVTPQGGLPAIDNPNGYYQTNQAVGLKALVDWNNPSTPLTVAATALILTGPAPTSYIGAIRAMIGVPTQEFTVTPNGLYTGTVIPSDASVILFLLSSGTFNPPSLTFNNSSDPQTFTYTPTKNGYIPISIIATNAEVSASIYIDVLPAGVPRP